MDAVEKSGSLRKKESKKAEAVSFLVVNYRNAHLHFSGKEAACGGK
jgi:hypothetical protein